MLRVIRTIYSDRTFQVKDAGCTSESHHQHYGICQGCPLSPFLFVMVMTVLMHDAKQLLRAHPAYTPHGGQQIEELLYADDTLLIHSDPAVVKAYMDCVSSAGANYGLQFNWAKLENMPVRCNAEFFTPNGDPIRLKQSFKYLGSMLSNSGQAGTELSCRLGASRTEFDNLCRVWSHASLSQQKKLRIYEACVVSKLMYSLEVVYLNAAKTRKLDAFHHKCLRRIAGIKPSYVSRVSKATVRNTLHAKPLAQTLLQRQLIYLGKLAAKPPNNVLREFVFEDGRTSLRPFFWPKAQR